MKINPAFIFTHYPHNDLLACGSPDETELVRNYIQRVKKDGDDTLYLFILRELCTEDIDIETANQRLDMAISDLQIIKTALKKIDAS